jgi:hypothetical protein
LPEVTSTGTFISGVSTMKKSDHFSDIKHRPISIPKSTIDLFLKEKEPIALMGLYFFYYYTAIWQETNQPFCTIDYVAKGISKSKKWVRKYKKKLVEIGLIEDIITREKGKIKGHYIRVYYYTNIPKSSKNPSPPYPFCQGWQKWEPNAYNNNNINAYSEKPLCGFRKVTKTNKNDSLYKNINICNKSPVNNKYTNIPLYKYNNKQIDFYTRMSKQLADTVRQKRKINRNVSIPRGASYFYKLKTDGINKKRIKKVLLWYIRHMGEPYVPVAYLAKTFYEKFLSIEDAMSRHLSDNPEISKTAKRIYKAIQDYGLDTSDNNLLNFIQQSVDNFKEYSKKHNAAIKNISSEETIEFARDFYKELKMEEFLENWMITGMKKKVRTKDLVFTFSSNKFQTYGKRRCTEMYGDDDLWKDYMKGIYAN